VSEGSAPDAREDDLPPIIDPYLSGVSGPSFPSGSPAGSPLGPGGVVPRSRASCGVASVLTLIAAVAILFVGGLGAVTAYHVMTEPGDQRTARAADDEGDDEDEETEEEDDDDDEDDETDTDEETTGLAPDNDEPRGKVPKDDVEKRVGDIVVVDIGYDNVSLEEALRAQRDEARQSGDRLLVMTVRELCEPCDGVDASLAHPLMQQTLRGIRVVRVDTDVFRHDLTELGMFASPYPGYFLFGPDLTLRDAIDGGEWGLDIAENIAPVLGPFLRGEYKNRKTRYRPRRGGGVAL
jgi:hypothetical protein